METQIETYFNFLAEDDLRIKGTRIGIETVLDAYIHNGKTAEAIADRYHTVTLEQVYATILYYLQNREKVGAYLENYLGILPKSTRRARENPSPAVIRLRELVAEKRKTSDNSRPSIPKSSSESTTPSPSKYERKQRC